MSGINKVVDHITFLQILAILYIGISPILFIICEIYKINLCLNYDKI